jgi:predicted  nucleic acid-binding Zn-ribbon protein
MIEMKDFKKDINNSLKEIQKSQRKTTLRIENLERKSGAIDASITNRIQEIEEYQVQKIPQKTLTEQSKKM